MSRFSRLTADLDDAQIYRLLAGIVVPRPIALVSTLSPRGVPNLAPFSFYAVASATPPVLSLSIDLRYGRDRKDTLDNICATGEFVINAVSEEIVAPMNVASFDWPPEVDEFAVAGLTAEYSSLNVRAPRVAQSPAQFECRLLRTIEMGKWTLVLGEVVAFHCADGLLDARLRVDLDRLQAVGRLSGNQYCRTGERFSLSRSDDSPDKKLNV